VRGYADAQIWSDQSQELVGAFKAHNGSGPRPKTTSEARLVSHRIAKRRGRERAKEVAWLTSEVRVRWYNLDVGYWHLRLFGVQSSNPYNIARRLFQKLHKVKNLPQGRVELGIFHEDSRSSLPPRRPPHLSTLRPSYASPKAFHRDLSTLLPSLSDQDPRSVYFGLYFQNPNSTRALRIQRL
jgi:hypothetical protein